MSIITIVRKLVGIYMCVSLIFSLTWVPSASAQDKTRNFILTRTYKVKTSADRFDTPVSVGEANLSVGYFDGLGRLQQTIAVQAGKGRKDLVVPIEYDAFGRQSKLFLPVSTDKQNGSYTSNATSLASAYYNSAVRFADPTSRVYTETRYEASPLGRPKENVAAGTTVPTTINYELNNHGIWNYWAGPGLTSITRIGYYDINLLTVKRINDENGKAVAEYHDNQGRLLLRRMAGGTPNQTDTYYVYDDLGRLRAVLQPKYDEISMPTSTDLDKFAFLYLYDSRGRLIEKQIPGGGKTTMLYNDRDLLISFRDATNQVFYHKYDVLNRQIEMGVCLGAGCTLTAPGNMPNNNPLTFTYYDNYESILPPFNVKLGDGSFGFENVYSLNSGDDFLPANVRTASRKGLPTGQCSRLLSPDGSLSTEWDCSVTYYDDRERIVQTVRRMPMGSNGLERISYKYDFLGKPLREKTTQSWSSDSYTLERILTYDQADRLTSTRYITSSTAAGMAKDIYVNTLSYNEVGQLTDKYLNANDATGTGAIERLTYRNNVRGWLREHKGTNVNRPYQITLNYESNGNIKDMYWKTPTSAAGSYQFVYDELNRMKSGRTGLNSGQGEVVAYNVNGNINGLHRYNAAGTAIDQLTYSYNGNRLMSIYDPVSNLGYNNRNTSGNDFSYDENGNLTADLDRQISSIAYNYLNLPRRVTLPGKNMDYTYDASGQKHRMTVNGTVTSYEGNFEYGGNGLLTRIATDEGQLVKVDGAWKWQYYLKDHLGNVRVVLDESGSVVQETDYYPFGLAIPKNPSDLVASRDKNKYLYLTRELQQETGWLDLKARFYDPTLARFLSVDPLAEAQEFMSPYHYGYNNPMRFSDPNGRMPDCCDGIGDFFSGVGQALNENMGWGNPAIVKPGYVGAYNAGRTVGHYASVVAGAAEIAGGALGLGTSVGAELGSAGLLTPVVATTATGSVALVTHGGNTAMNAIDNIRNDKGRVNAEGKYSGLKEPRNVGDGKSFTPAQKKRILEENRAKNGGNIKSDQSGNNLNSPQQSKKGQKADMNQAEIDHIKPKSKGGSNSNSNARVISKEENLRKGNREN
ncbi:DUF6443 domain-containing protein [Arundinibacter roseus]|uniref:RHS repeat-associated core domain-containing protein n=1 Tax=Arundinibacter roseus TaxID=2070510 RepID=A0A4R4JUX6_9BACT|nr:DUF6443 domain-containing protein [Arundinibacter roseus]TDB58550.1 hypothetical protein EZE20_23095 [Arundinibacter roseus]